MIRNFTKFIALFAIFAFVAVSGFAQDQAEMRNPIVIHAIAHDVSPALSSIPPVPRIAGVKRVVPNKRIPLPEQLADAVAMRDAAIQSSAPVMSAPSVGKNIEGIGDTNYSILYSPPDTNGDVGLTQYVQTVNVGLAVWDKASGAMTYGPVDINTLWSGFGGGCQGNNDGDAVVKYDKAANRWVISQFSVSTTPYLQCVAVSTTSNATGSYYRYAFQYTQFNDYPKMGVWPDAYYVTYNMFTSSFQGAKVCAMDRAKMLTGAAATQQCFQTSTSYGGLLPSDWYGATAPPAGSPNYVMNYGSSKLNMWKFHVDFATPANTTFTGPTAIPVTAFTAACGGGTCIPQSGTANKLDSLADRLMNSLVYRNLGTSESMVVNHSVYVSKSKGKEVDGVRWYEIRLTGGNPSLYQQGTWTNNSDGKSRWMGSIAMDKVGNIGLGYSVSSPAMFPSIRYTGRVPGDTLGTMQAETNVIDGSGYQKTGLTRWGDYSSMSIDPSDDCTFWFTTEYLKSNGYWNWSTRINSFKFATCN